MSLWTNDQLFLKIPNIGKKNPVIYLKNVFNKK